MERTARIATGESVAFTYELAGLGSRFFAVFVDVALQLAFLTLIVVAYLVVANAFASHARPTALAKAGSAVLTALGVVAGFVLFFGYFIVLEWRWQGRTPGKRLVGIRVVRDGGFPLDFTSSVIRNVVRLLEVGLGLYAVSALVVLLSPANRRLGDMAAGTLVVRDNRFERPAVPPQADDLQPGDDPLVRDLTPAQRALVRRYAERRASLAPEYRLAVAAEIAAGIRPRLSTSFAHLDDEDLLVHLATTALAARLPAVPRASSV